MLRGINDDQGNLLLHLSASELDLEAPELFDKITACRVEFLTNKVYWRLYIDEFFYSGFYLMVSYTSEGEMPYAFLKAKEKCERFSKPTSR